MQQSGPFGDFRAFVAGATGGTGQAIVRRLVAEGVPVRALVRDISKAVSVKFSLASHKYAHQITCNQVPGILCSYGLSHLPFLAQHSHAMTSCREIIAQL